MTSKHVLACLLGLGSACSGSGSIDPQDGLERSENARDETVDGCLSQEPSMEPAQAGGANAEQGTPVTVRVLARYSDGEDLAPAQPALEVLRTDPRFSEIVTSLGSKAGFGLPHPDGSRWYPEVDFDSNVVLWIHAGVENISATFEDFSATQTAEAITVHYTLGVRSCIELAAQGYPIAFVELPKLEQSYRLSPRRPVSCCPQ
jgi:hypothetical protein